MNELVLFGIIVGILVGFPIGLLLGQFRGTMLILKLWEETERKNKVSRNEEDGGNIDG